MPSETEWQRRQDEFTRKQQEQFQRNGQKAEKDKFAKEAASTGKEQVVKTWEHYVRSWDALKDVQMISFRAIPWPLMKTPKSTDDLTTNAIGALVLSPHHSPEKSPRDRLKAELLRWHPDRFESKWLPKADVGEKEAIRRGAGQVVRCLNELMGRENNNNIFA